MSSKVRKQIYIDGQEAVIKHLAFAAGTSEADLNAWERVRQRIEQLIEQGPVPGERAWRREDLYK